MGILDLAWWQIALCFAVPLNYIYWIFIHPILFDGPAMVSTGVDSRDGNTVGDDCKSSKSK